MRTTVGLVIGFILLAALAVAKQPPPVIRELGPVVPTPAPSPHAEQRIRLISSFTVQNKPDGPSVISFEATDFGREAALGKDGKDRYRILATELYTLVEPKPAARALADQIMHKLRDLEGDLQEFVEVTGPPRARQPVTEQGPVQRPR